MLVPSWTLQIIVDNIFSYILAQSGLADRIRTRLGHEPVRQAYQDALGRALEYLGKQYPKWESDLFDASFLENEGAPILAQFLIRDGHPDAGELAACWANSLNIRHQEHRNILVRELEPVAADFLDFLTHELKKKPELSELHDSRIFEQLAIDLQALRYRLGAERATSGTRRDYLHWLIERNLYLDPRGTYQTQRQVQVRLDEVYISLRAQRDKIPSEVDRRLFEQEMIQLEAKIIHTHLSTEAVEDRREHIEASVENLILDAKDVPSEVIDLAEAVNEHDRLIILGDPGSGKSTLLRYLALKHAQASYAGRSEVGLGLGIARFPLLIRIADYAEHGMPYGKSLSNYLVDYFDMHECPKFGLADLLATELASGNCLILLDGLDEIVNADDRRKVVDRIEDFIRHHDNHTNRFVITSRIAGYRSAPLGDPFAHYTVQEMDEEQIYRFLKRWCTAVEAVQTPDLSQQSQEATARNEFDGIMRAVRGSLGIRRLAANPLLLRTLALIHRTGAQLPQRRVELYKLAADTLARTWRTAQGVPESALVEDTYLTRLLGKLAYWLHINKATGIATEQEVYRELGQEWARIKGTAWDEDNPDIKNDIRKFLQQVREHTGLFVERAPKRYGFMHLTFEEYYVARHLIARSKSRAELIRQHLHDPRWDEPILLALGFVGLDSPEDASELLETAILAQGEDARERNFTPSKYEDLLGRDYLFALRCLSNGIPVDIEIMQRLLERLANELIYQTGSARFSRYRQTLEKRLYSLRGSKAASALLPLIITAFDNPNAEVRRNAALSMGLLEQVSSEVISILLQAFKENDLQVTTWAIENLGQLGQISAEAVSALLLALEDNDRDVRGHAAGSLGLSRQASAEVVSALLLALKDNALFVRRYAAWSLGLLGQASAEVVSALLLALKDDDSVVRNWAAWSLGLLGQVSADAVNVLLQAIKDDDSTVRSAAAYRLGSLRQASTEVVSALLQALVDNDPIVCNRAAHSLGSLGQASAEVMSALLQAIKDDDVTVRSAAASSLGSLRQASAEVMSALLQAIKDDDTTVSYWAAYSLGQLGTVSDQVVAILVEELQKAPQTSIRFSSAYILGRLGRTEESILEALLRGFLDDNNDVRTACVRALVQLARSPIAQMKIEERLFEAVTDPEFDKTFKYGTRSAHDYAFDGLWSLLMRGELEEEQASGFRYPLLKSIGY